MFPLVPDKLPVLRRQIDPLLCSVSSLFYVFILSVPCVCSRPCLCLTNMRSPMFVRWPLLWAPVDVYMSNIPTPLSICVWSVCLVSGAIASPISDPGRRASPSLYPKCPYPACPPRWFALSLCVYACSVALPDAPHVCLWIQSLGSIHPVL